MKKDILYILILYSLFGAILGGLLFLIKPFKDYGTMLFWIAISFGQLSGTILFLLQSNLNKTTYFKILIACGIICILGILFKIQHWQGSFIILSLGLLFTLITYFFRFINKISKTFQDYIKLIWLLLVALGLFFKINHWPYGDNLLFISIGIFWIGLLHALYDYKFKKQISN